MSLDDLFNSSFFITITISAIMVALLYTYVSNKLNEQNHKLQTMVGIITSLTQEIEYWKHSKHSQPGGVVNQFGSGMVFKNPNLIDVSVSSNESEEEADDEDEDDEDDDEEDDEEEDDEEEDDEEEDDEEDDDEEDEDDEEDDDDKKDSGKIKKSDLVIEDLNELPPLEVDSDELTPNNNIKILNIHDISEQVTNTIEKKMKQNFKKMKLPELKQLLKEKNPSIDADKYKKDELIQLLSE